MIQNNSILQVIDNSGAKKVLCIKVFFGFRRRYAYSGDLITVSIKTMRKKRRTSLKVKKGLVIKALILRTKSNYFFQSKNYTSFKENCCILLSKQNKLLGTRIFGTIPIRFRYTRFLRVVSLAAGTS